jgi:hypothetical protein
MCNYSNYYEQARILGGLSVQDAIVVKEADAYTFYREVSKVAMVIGLVSSATSVIFQRDPAAFLTFTAFSGFFWCYFQTCAQYLEAQAKHAIKQVKTIHQLSSLDIQV